ncbi:glycosyltransferase [Acidaminococcus fermentans DSM 20731]|uniref:glycosyltransferase n=1 Tax=Acidaminococcus fermentans TaxID=905 RepID=UPI001D15494C|nr:glycosyltransferase [Acidaminococcus fermentans]UEA72430.1 glycosyltransferase [Acidaminococcus fermentans DSM 20731]
MLQVLSGFVNSGGVSSVLMNYYRKLDKSKVQFDFLYFNKADENLIKEVEKMGGKVFYVSKPTLSKCSIGAWDKFFSIYGSKYDIVHNNQIFLNGFLAYFVKKYTHAKLVMHEHASQWGNRPSARIRNYLLTISSFQFADAYFACSSKAYNFAFNRVENLFKSKESYIMNNAINLQDFDYNPEIRQQMRRKWGISDKSFVIGHVGRFELEKNHIFLLKIFKEFLLLNPGAVLLLVGDGSLKEQIINESKRLKIFDNVIFAGKHQDIYNYYQMMDVFVLPSKFEGLGMACVEAEASGLPVFCSLEVPKIVDVVNCNYLGLNASPKTWAEAIIKYRRFQRKSTILDLSGSIFDINCEVDKLVNEYYHILGR